METTYDYIDASGKLLFQVVRLNPKSFRQRRPGGQGGWYWDMKGIERIPYRLPQLLHAAPHEKIWIVEGEKDVDTLASRGLVATTNAGGALKWEPDFARYFAGRHVVIVPDADPVDPKSGLSKGQQHAQSVAQSLAGVASSIKLLDLSELCEKLGLESLPSKGDCSDFVALGGTIEDLKAAADGLAEYVVANEQDGDSGHFGTLSDADLGLISADTLDPEPIFWLWDRRIARGKMNLLAGEGGDGKSQISLAVAAAVSSGMCFPDGSGPADVGRCLILAAEDGSRDTVIPRLKAAGAVLGRVSILTARVTLKDRHGKLLISHMSFQDIPYWREVFRRLPDTSVLLVDPIPAYLGRGVNDNRNAEIRQVLEPFIALCEAYKVSLIGITHLSKSTDAKTPVHKILGSVAYSNLARTVHLTTRDPDDRERRLLLQVKSNVAKVQPGLAYRVEGFTFEHAGRNIETSRVVFESESIDADATALMCSGSTTKRRGPDPKKARELASWLFDHLAAELTPVPLAALFDLAGSKGYLGEQKEDGRWSSPMALYRAADLVPELEAPRDGWRVETLSRPLRPGGREIRHWQLWAKDSPSNSITR